MSGREIGTGNGRPEAPDTPGTPASGARAPGVVTDDGPRRPPPQSGPGFGPPGLMGSGVKAKDFKGSFKRLAGQLRPDALKIYVVVALAIVSVVLTVAGPKILARATDLIFEGFISSQLPPGATKEQVIARLQAQGQEQLASMLSSMDLTPGLGVDMGAVGRVLVIVPLSVLVTVLIAKRSQKQFAVQWERTGSLSGHVEEMFTGHNIVKVFGRQKEAIARFDEENDQLYRASFKAQFISGIIMPSMMFIGNLNYVAICVLGGLRVASGTMSLGDVQAFVQYSRQFTQPITQTASVANVLQSAVASAERVFELLDEAEESPDVAEPVVLTEVSGHLSLRDVSFRYVPDTPLIENLDLEVEPGQTVAIVGPTGAGKTTLVNLLMRFYEIDEGSILIDDVDTRSMARADLRRLFGMVLQDAWLFGGTIRENIAYGSEDATEGEILAAAEAAHVDHFVRTLAEGYDTRLDDDSGNVSQGERQLLTIARAFLVDPQILILDEATSSVDTRTEVLIQKAMSRLLRGLTSFVIAHRLSTIRDADVILVMNEGSILEKGTHEDLLSARGFYHDLYNSQFAEALAEAS